MLRRLALILVLLAFVPACTPQPTTTSTMRMLEVKASLDTLWTRYAFASDTHDAAGFGLLFAEDATLALPNVPTKRGLPAIEECLGQLYTGVDATALRVDQHLSGAGERRDRSVGAAGLAARVGAFHQQQQ